MNRNSWCPIFHAKEANGPLPVLIDTTPQEESFARLAIPVPPDLDRAFGYFGHARYVGFCWEDQSDKLLCSDGQTTVLGANWPAWITFVRYPCIKDAIASFGLGNLEDATGRPVPATHMMLIDRVKCAIRMGEISEVRAYLEAQWVTLGAGKCIEPPEYMQSSILATSPEQLKARVSEQLEAVATMKEWLDKNTRRKPFLLRVFSGRSA